MLLKSLNDSNIILSWMVITATWLLGVSFSFYQCVYAECSFGNTLGYHFCVLAIATLINFYTKKHKFTSNTNYIPAFLCIVFFNAIPEQHQEWEVVASIALFCMVIQRLIGLYNTKHNYLKVYEIGVLTGLAIIIYPPFVLLALFYIIGLTLTTSFSWRDFVIPLIGIFTVVFWSFLLEFLTPVQLAFFQFFKGIQLPKVLNSFGVEQFLLISLSLCQVLVLLKLFAKIEKQNIKVRIHYWLWVWFAVFLMISLIVFQNPFQKVVLIALLGLPTSIFAIEYFIIEQRKPYWKKNLFLTCLTSLCICIRIFI